MINFILWILVGAFAGWVASMIMKADARMGAVANIVAGIAGAFVGGWLSRTLFSYDPNTFSFMGVLVAIAGATLVIFVVQLLTGRRHA